MRLPTEAMTGCRSPSRTIGASFNGCHVPPQLVAYWLNGGNANYGFFAVAGGFPRYFLGAAAHISDSHACGARRM